MMAFLQSLGRRGDVNLVNFTLNENSLLDQKREFSAPGRIRTLNPQSRNLVFYPVELRALLEFISIKMAFIMTEMG